ncbi:MAG: DegT/DnrJ/EryC1/StrS aminotransferase [Thermoprotei archaeon]|nr:MAG: DegT/DnrJ/EryC1/StrS aminotransferase [Thermoprotei archaeon]
MEKPAIEGGVPIRDSPMSFWPTFTEEEKKLVLSVLESGKVSSIAGKMTRTFEQKFSEYIGTRYALAVSNGTAALHTAIAALGIGAGDEVITTPFSFIATATSILHNNAVPVFADIDLDTFNMDPETIPDKITDRTKAILVVHLAGHPAEMDKIIGIAREYGLKIIEDCAQAIGTEYRGRKVGTFGEIAAFSFYQSKNMTTGEGGMVVTNNDDIYEKARLFINHGQVERYLHVSLGWNYRMTELQAALGLGQLSRIDELNSNREKIAKVYSEELSELDGDLLKLPRAKPYVKHTWHIYQVLLYTEKLKVDRDYIVKALKAENILVTVAYPRTIYENPLFQKLDAYGKGCPWKCPFQRENLAYGKGLAPRAEYVARRVITLPTLAGMTEEDAVVIARALKKVLSYYKR